MNGKAVKLTEKQRRFCELYAIEPNAAKAAIAAGYSEKTARATGCENLTKQNIIDYIKELRKDAEQLLGFNKETLLNELKSIAMQNISDYLEDWGELKDFEEVDKSKKKAITNIEIVETSTLDGGKVVNTKLKLGNKIQAITELVRIMGYDKQEAPTANEGKFTVNINPIVAPETSGLIESITNVDS